MSAMHKSESNRTLGKAKHKVSIESRVPKQYQKDQSSSNFSAVVRDMSPNTLRTLYLLDAAISQSDLHKDLFRQLQAKDILIDQLNSRLITAIAQTKRIEVETGKERQMKEILEENLALTQSLSESKSAYTTLQGKYEALALAYYSEKESLELLNEAVTEENEELKAKLRNNATQVATSKTDVGQLSKIIEDLTKLNEDLKNKVAELNAEMEKKNEEHYEAVMKAKQTEELEKELVEAKTECLTLRSRVEGSKDRAAEVKDLRQLLFQMTDELVRNLGKVTLSDQATKEAVISLDQLAKEIGKEAAAADPQAAQQISSLKQQIAHLKIDFASQKRAAVKAITEKQYHESNILSVRADNARLKSEYETNTANGEEKLKLLQSSVNYLLRTRKQVEEKCGEAEAELAKKQTEATHLAELVTRLKARQTDLQRNKSELQNSCTQFQGKVIQLENLRIRQEQQHQSLKTQLKVALGKISALSDELWKRDNKLLHKECNKLKLMEEVNLLKTTLQSSRTRLKFGDVAGATWNFSGKEADILMRRTAGTSRISSVQSLGAVIDKLEHGLKTAKSPFTRTKKNQSQDLGQESTEALKVDLQAYSQMKISIGSIQNTEHLKDLYEFLSASSLTVEQVLEQISNLCK